jgi:hypothetical protein
MSDANQIDTKAISALKALIGKPIGAIYGREVHAEPLRSSASMPAGAFWVSGDTPDFVTIETEWKTSKGDQDYHLLKIARAKKPLELPYNERTGAIGPCSLIEMSMPGASIDSIDVIEMTAELDDTVVYDHALTFRFDDGNAITISTEHDSILGALIVRGGEAQAREPEFETLKTRMTLK